MPDKPILMCDASVRAILDGRKTVTRRATGLKNTVNLAPASWRLHDYDTDGSAVFRSVDTVLTYEQHVKPRYAVGDTLWAREGWRTDKSRDRVAPSMLYCESDPPTIQFRADNGILDHVVPPLAIEWGKWRPGIHMPRWACRLRLGPVVDVRPERVLDVTDEDAIREGVFLRPSGEDNPRDAYLDWLTDLHGPRIVDENWWVWRIEWEGVRCAR
jgi:hypothetical protein